MILLAALLVRLLASLDDFWLDEIWSWSFARSIHSPVEIFTSIHHDNNHKLNTLFLYLIGDADHWFLYRLPSLVAGVAGVAVAGVLARRRGTVEALTVMVLMAGSYFLIHYSSEARGYSWAVLFALLSWHCACTFAERPRLTTAAGFWAAAVGGALSHSTYLYLYCAVLIWSLYHFARSGDSKRSVLHLVTLHAVPLGFYCLLYWFDIRHLSTGGGEPYSLPEVVMRASALCFGAPLVGILPAVATLAAVGLLGWGVWILRREQDDQWVLFAAAVCLVPVVAVTLLRPHVLYERYFLVPATFLLLLAGYMLGYVYNRGRAGKGVYAALMALLLAGNGYHVAMLSQHGRGGYLRAVRTMADHSHGSVLTVGSDHDFRNGMVLKFYERYLPSGSTLAYVPQASLQAAPPDWFITHSLNPASLPPERLTIAGSVEYSLAATFPYSALSGWNWHLYRKRL